MERMSGSLRPTLAILVTFCFATGPALALTPPFVGPPGVHDNLMPIRVDVNGNGPDGTDPAGWFEDRGAIQFGLYAGSRAIYVNSPWRPCAVHGSDDDFTLWANNQGPVADPNILDRFGHWGRQLTLVATDGRATGGVYVGLPGDSWAGDSGTINLEKSNPGNDCYDQVRLVNTSHGGAIVTLLSLVEQAGYIGVANIASLGQITPCGQVSANTQIWAPLATDDDGKRVVVVGDPVSGGASANVLYGPPVCGRGAAPVVTTPTTVPTLSEWGMAALSVVLLILSLFYLKKRGLRISV